MKLLSQSKSMTGLQLKHLLPLFLLFFLTPFLSFAQKTVSGVITEADGQPLIGANVLVKGTNIGTITAIDGSYTLENVPDDAVIVVSFIGYDTQEIITEGRNAIDVSVTATGQLLDELVVTGYSVERKRDLLGAVGVVNLDDIEGASNPNVLQSMQGRMAGVNVTTDGNPGQGTRVRVRGISTLGNNDPLYIVDGVPFQSFQTDDLNNGVNQNWGLSWLNPNDIESIQVLKDASSASIYGSRASNGVVIITTKQPGNREPTISVNIRTTVENWNSFDNLLNSDQRARVDWMGAVNDGTNPDALSIWTYDWHFDPSLGPGIQGNGVPVLDRIIYPEWLDEADQMRPAGHPASIHGGDITVGTNWWDEISQTGITQNYDISFAQGGERGGIYFGANYYNQKGVVIETGYERIGLRMNSNYNFLDGRITVGENLSVTKGARQWLDRGVGETTGNPYSLKTIVPVLTEDGRFAAPPGSGFEDTDNPVALAHDNRDDIINNLKVLGNVYLEAEIIEGLRFRTMLGVDYDNIFSRDIFRTYSRGFLSNVIAELDHRQSHIVNWVFNNTLTYNKSIGDHVFTVLAGAEAVENNVTLFFARAKEFALETNAYFQLDAASGERNSGGSTTGFSLFSYFGKVNYAFQDKYLFSATVRRDGSSRFGLSNRFAVFPAISVGWRLSEEPFLRDNNVISNLKVRAAWGKTGNQDILNTARFSLYQAIYAPPSNILPWTGGCYQTNCANAATAYDIGNQDQGILPSGFSAQQTGNDDLKWESTTELNLGLDFGLLDDRITGTVEVFNKQTEDILIVRRTVGAFGDGAIRFVNGADMETDGWELSLNYASPAGRDLTWSVGTNLGHYDAKITFLPEDLYGSYPGNQEQNIIGHAPNAQFGYRTSGIFQSQAEVEAHADQTGARVGALRFEDLNGDGVISGLDREYGPANGVPDVEFGLNFQINYKNWDLSLFTWGALGRRVQASVGRELAGSSGSNAGVATLDAWSFTNTDSYIPAISFSRGLFGNSLDYHVRNGNYFSFRQATLGYTFPANSGWSNVFTNLRFYITGENLGWIVDRSGSNQFPSVGWHVEDAVEDRDDFPKPQRFSFGLNANF